MLSGKKIVLGVTGGIAAYKACEVVSRLKKLGANVDVIMTENATKLVAPLTFETLSQNQAYVDCFDRKFQIGHVSLAKWADLFIIAPCTSYPCCFNNAAATVESTPPAAPMVPEKIPASRKIRHIVMILSSFSKTILIVL